MDPQQRRSHIRDAALDGVQSLFPIIGDHREIHLERPRIDSKDFSSEDHKKALLAGKTMAESLKGSIVIKGKDGELIDRKDNHTLLRVPYFTDHNTFVVGGTEYVVRNQLRTRPGVYTRFRGNDQVEAAFNLAKGHNFRLSMDADKGHVNMEYGASKVPLYPILRGMGMTHSDVRNAWGAKVADRNQDAFDGSRERHIGKLYDKLTHPNARTAETATDKMSAINTAYSEAVLDEETTGKTLGTSYKNVGPSTLLNASKKMLRVFRGEETPDNRDSLEFQTIHSVDDFVKERLDLSGRDIRRKLKSKLDLTPKPVAEKIIPSSMLTPTIKSFLTTSQLSVTPTQINPVEFINNATTVTRFGEGGIASERAIPAEIRTLHPSQMGFLDPFGTPESSHAGVDVRAAMLAHKDEQGRLYTRLRNVKTGKVEFVPSADIEKTTVAFSDQDITKGRVDVLQRGKATKVRPRDVDYQVPHSSYLYGPATNLIPFLDSTQGNRAIMGSKMVGQALPLQHREVPLVQVQSYLEDKSPMEKVVARSILPTAPASGVVSKVSGGRIYIKDSSGKSRAVNYSKNHPFASKTYLHHDVIVKKGDKVKAGDVLAESNFTKDGTLALGTNLKAGYMAYHGLNSNDAVVISESASKKLTSDQMVKKVIQLDDTISIGDKKHAANFPRVFTDTQYAVLNDGVVRPGTILKEGDPIVASVRKAPPSIENEMFGRIHKSLRRTYVDDSLTWDKGVEGRVVDVERGPNRVTLTIKSAEPMKLGDKLSNRFGGKGVVSKILPDSEMISDSTGKPLDLLWTSAGVISRINPSQVLEAAVAKVADKQGKPLVVQSFKKRDNVKWAKKLLKENGVKDKETVFDPVTRKSIPNIMVGPQYIYKMFKATETNYSARGAGGSYDVNQQPGRGGIEGAKGVGGMEVNALLAHDARDTLKENTVVKGTRNSEYWRAVQLGLPIPSARAPFAHDKFVSMLTGAGLRLGRDGNHVSMAPLTDRDVTKMSSGAIANAKMVRAKDLRTERGGLFDDAATGGLSGKKWTHIDLPEPVVSPVFRDPVRRLLGYTENTLAETIREKGGAHIKRELSKIDVGRKEAELRKDVWKLPKGAAQDNAVKQIKALQALRKNNLKPSEAYTLSKVPVLPPVFRPIVPGPRGDLLVADVNHMYKDLILAKDKLQEAKSLDLPDTDIRDMRGHLQDAVGAVAGLNPPVSPKVAAGKKKGLINTITGTKDGFYNGKLVARRLDLTARGTAAPDPSLNLDEFGMPESMAWTTYKPFITQRLVRRGHSALRAKDMVENKNPVAREALSAEMATRPALINRAPSLHRYNIMAAYPKMIPGKTIQVNPFIESGMNLDYDGDALQIHVPASPGAVKDAEKMLISKHLLGSKERNDLMIFPAHEAIIGLHKATNVPKSGASVRKFSSAKEALAAYNRGEISLSDRVEVDEP
tara:strand:- start:1173 stop:5492 length:4320 start_codon:yes stop_codon:yes gene_type:complete